MFKSVNTIIQRAEKFLKTVTWSFATFATM